MCWLVALLLLTGVTVSQSQQPSPSSGILSNKNQSKASDQATQADANQRDTDKSPIIVQIAPGPNAEKEAAQAKKDKEEKTATDHRVEITTDLIAFATLIQAVALIITIIVMVRNGRRQLRAYVLLDNAKFSQPDIEGGDSLPWRIHIVFRNFGKTPAFRSIITAARRMNVKEGQETALTIPDDAERSAVTVIAPGHPHIMRLGGLERGLVDFVAAGESGQIAYIWGRVDYVDTFGIPHFTTFQMACRFDQKIHQFGFCQNGNGTDDRFHR